MVKLPTHRPKPRRTPGVVLGIGLGGFIDGIVFHQILHWHNMGSAVLPPSTVGAMRQNMAWDGWFHLLTLAITIAVYLALAMGAMVAAGRVFGLPGPDRTALFFCGSTKSLASGLPIASAIFPVASVGAIVLPVMLFHISQLLVCAIVSQRIVRAQARLQTG